MLIYYLQAIARSLKFTNNQLRMQLQTVSHTEQEFTEVRLVYLRERPYNVIKRELVKVYIYIYI